MTIAGVQLEIDREGVVIRAAAPLRILSSAVSGGGPGRAPTIVNVHVPPGFRAENAERALCDFVARRKLPAPWVGLLTAALTENAETATESAGGLTATAITTVGLSHPSSAGLSEAVVASALSTINTIVIVDAVPDPAAMVNLVMTVTEVKAVALVEAGVRTPTGDPASGTSSDAVVIAATDRGARCEFGGPVSELGFVAARATRRALTRGIERWLRDHP